MKRSFRDLRGSQGARVTRQATCADPAGEWELARRRIALEGVLLIERSGGGADAGYKAVRDDFADYHPLARGAIVTLKPEDERVDVWLEHEPTRWPCPDCGETVPAFDHAAERTWRHLDTCPFQTHLHAKIPRVQCPAHGVKQVRVPWAEPRSRFTEMLERLIIDPGLQCRTVKGACEICGRQLGRGLGRDEPRRRTGSRAEGGAADHLHRRRRAGVPATAIAITRSCATSSARPSEFVAEDRKTESLCRILCPVDGRPAAGAARRRDGHVGGVHRRHAGRHARRRREDRLRSRVHIMREMTKAWRYGPQTGASRFSAGRRGFAADRHQVPVAVQRRAAAGAACGRVRDAPSAESQSRARVGDQRSVAGLVDLPSACGREAVLHALVWLGDPLAARAREAGGEDVEAASRRGAPLCPASDHEWRG